MKVSTGKYGNYIIPLVEAAVSAAAQSRANNYQDIMRVSYIHRNVQVWRASSNIADKCVLLIELPADPV